MLRKTVKTRRAYNTTSPFVFVRAERGSLQGVVYLHIAYQLTSFRQDYCRCLIDRCPSLTHAMKRQITTPPVHLFSASWLHHERSSGRYLLAISSSPGEGVLPLGGLAMISKCPPKEGKKKTIRAAPTVMTRSFLLLFFRKPELYQMRGAPFTKKRDGKVRDRGGEVIDLFPGVREILLEVHRGHRFRDTKLAIASRTSHDRWGFFFCDWCRRALGELRWL